MPISERAAELARRAARPLLSPVRARYRALPTARKLPFRRAMLASLDAVELALGLRPPDMPPRWLRFVGPGDFRAIGSEFARLCADVGGLRPGMSLLDVGCGAGRMAAPLRAYLGSDGRYVGIDVVPEAIAWCRKALAGGDPRLRFEHLDVRNARYNPDGAMDPTAVRFPVADSTFDLVLVASVFTHMPADAVERYLHEIARSLRPGGACLATFFLVDDDVGDRAASNAADHEFPFREPDGLTRTERAGDPDHLAAFDAEWVARTMEACGLRLDGGFRRGGWASIANPTTYQDLVLARRIDIGSAPGASIDGGDPHRVPHERRGGAGARDATPESGRLAGQLTTRAARSAGHARDHFAPSVGKPAPLRGR